MVDDIFFEWDRAESNDNVLHRSISPDKFVVRSVEYDIEHFSLKGNIFRSPVIAVSVESQRSCLILPLMHLTFLIVLSLSLVLTASLPD